MKKNNSKKRLFTQLQTACLELYNVLIDLGVGIDVITKYFSSYNLNFKEKRKYYDSKLILLDSTVSDETIFEWYLEFKILQKILNDYSFDVKIIKMH